MSGFSLTLDSFIQPVPVGEPTTDLATAVKMFQSDRCVETMAIVSRRGLPLGAIRCRCLLSYIVKHFGIESTAPSGSRASLKQLQSSLARTKLQSLMEPVTILPARMRVDEWYPHLQERQQNPLDDSLYVLADVEGKFVGLLDSCALLKSLLASSPEERSETTRQLPFVLEGVLFQLLEQLPLPIMAYTSGGRILHRNLHWREQIGEFCPIDEGSFCPLLLEPTHESDAVLPVLSRGAIAELTPDIALDCLQDDRYLAAQLSRRQLLEVVPELLTVEDMANPLPSLERSQSSNLSSRLRQLKTVGDRAWQFVKFTLQLEQSDRAENFPLASHQSPTWLVIATDVTEHQRLCKELSAKNADLVQLNRLKDEFLACISHELKSPLTAVLGLSSLLKEQKLGELNQRQVHYAQLIYQSGRQLMSLVNDLLDLTRLETGQLKLNFAPVQIQIVCEQAYGAIKEQFKGKTEDPTAFSLEIEPGLETIIADELRVRQILVHLLDNAMKFTPAGKPIGLKVNRWENWIAFTVWDRGIGISEEHQHLIFQKFQQLESPLTRQFEGTGLGLFLTQRLARAHGGDISFISKVGVGSQFTLLLPPSPTPEKSGEVEGRQLRHPLVLVVEAMPRAIEDLTEKLIGLDYRVAIARTGTEALEKARQLQPHAIFLNPSLPLLSGWDVLTLLKSDAQTKKIRVIVTATKSDKTKSKQYGAGGFLSLPVEPGALQEILGEPENQRASKPKRLTILRLYPELQTSSMGDSLGVNSSFDLTLITQLSQLNHRILEADDLEQAEMLARVWKVDAVVLDGMISEESLDYWRSLGECEQLSTLPLVTLDTQTTEAANRVGNLSVFPCLVPADRNRFDSLLQVIQIAAESKERDAR
jgi:signal transduction histidine kinase/DNA-binding response OmpR family regulator